jgi:hypothetical protein
MPEYRVFTLKEVQVLLLVLLAATENTPYWVASWEDGKPFSGTHYRR